MSLSRPSTTIYHWNSIIDPRGILSTYYPEIIEAFKQGSDQLKSLGLDKKECPVDGIYSVKTNKKGRVLFWEYTDPFGRNHLVYFANAPEHDYRKTLLNKIPALKKAIAHSKKIYDEYFLNHKNETVGTAAVLPLMARNTKVITLESTQIQDRQLPLPLVLSGPPGASKTVIMMEKVLDYLYKNPNEKLPVLVYTKSRRLLIDIKTECEVSPEAIFYLDQIVFCTPKDLRHYLNLSLKPVEKDYFDKWYQSVHLPKIKAQSKNKDSARFDFLNKKKNQHREKIYQELLLLAAYTESGYTLGKKQCSFFDEQPLLRDTCKAYKNHVDENDLYHAGFSSFAPHLPSKKYFAAGFIDEAPNCRLLEITAIAELCEWNVAIVNDNRQDEIDTHFSKLDHIKNLAKISGKQLTVCLFNKSYRIPQTFSATLEELLDIDCILGKGINDTHQYKEIICAGAANGGIFWISSFENAKSNDEEKNILAFYEKIKDGPTFAVITHPEYIKEAIKIWGEDHLILTVTQSKGLEFEYVMGYRLLDLAIYDQASRELEKNPDAVATYHLPKDREGVKIYRKALHQLLIALTRSSKMMIMYQTAHPENPMHALYLKNRLFAKRTRANLSIELVNPSTESEWQDLMIKMIEVGKIEPARGIGTKHLNLSDEEINKMIISFSETEERPLENQQQSVQAAAATTTTTTTTTTASPPAGVMKELEKLLTRKCPPSQWQPVLQQNGFEKLMKMTMSNGLSLFKNITREGETKLNEFYTALQTYPKLLAQFIPPKTNDFAPFVTLWYALIELELRTKKSSIENDQGNRVLLENKQISFLKPAVQHWPMLTFLLDNKDKNDFFNALFKQIKERFKKENLNIIDLIFTANKTTERLLCEKFQEELSNNHILLELFQPKYRCEILQYMREEIERKNYFPAHLTVANLPAFFSLLPVTFPNTIEYRTQELLSHWLFKNIIKKHEFAKSKIEFLQNLEENKPGVGYLLNFIKYLILDNLDIQRIISLIIKHRYDYQCLESLEKKFPGSIKRLSVTSDINLLNEAIENDNTDCLLQLLHHHSPVFSSVYPGKNPIEIAWEKNKKAFAFILRHLTAYDDTELLEKLCALNLSSFDISTYAAAQGHNVLHYACSVNSFKVVKWLAEKYPSLLQGKSLDGRLPHQHAITTQHFTMLKWLIEKKGCAANAVNNANEPLIALLISENNTDAVEWLINYKGHNNLFDCKSYCPLLDAIQKGKTDVAFMLTTVTKKTFYTFNFDENKTICQSLKELEFDLFFKSLKFIVAGFKSIHKDKCENIFKERTFTDEELKKLYRLFEIEIFLGAQTKTMFYAWMLYQSYYVLDKANARLLCLKMEAKGYTLAVAELRALVKDDLYQASSVNPSTLFQPSPNASHNTSQRPARKQGP